MTETVKSIIFAIMGAVVLVAGILMNSGWEIIALGAAILVFSIVCIIIDNVKAKKSEIKE